MGGDGEIRLEKQNKKRESWDKRVEVCFGGVFYSVIVLVSVVHPRHKVSLDLLLLHLISRNIWVAASRPSLPQDCCANSSVCVNVYSME